jgi:hypothetical protein
MRNRETEQIVGGSGVKKQILSMVALTLLCSFPFCLPSGAQTYDTRTQMNIVERNQEIRSFIEPEVTTDGADIKTLEPFPDRVVSPLTTGEFSWGTFMRTLGEYSEYADRKTGWILSSG